MRKILAVCCIALGVVFVCAALGALPHRGAILLAGQGAFLLWAARFFMVRS